MTHAFAFHHIASFYSEALGNPELAPSLRSSTVDNRYWKYADMSEGVQSPDWEAQSRYDTQWGTYNGYSELDCQLAEREH